MFFFNANKLYASDVTTHNNSLMIFQSVDLGLLLNHLADVYALQVIITSINIDGILLLIGSHQKEKVK